MTNQKPKRIQRERLTPNQLRYLYRISDLGGSIYCMSGNRRVLFSLASKGLIESFGNSWYHLTKSGAQYLAKSVSNA